ncbi:Zinc finger, RING-like,Zinc finger, RING/FYVE/PHD-type [Cinara cedri]|uniref:Non-structural maintenance of chromosomes element 1 homolog n=1 Tax=Cinara cedri TaxID=506608 RepID=A0A5E4N1H3_9HEMI|nr:Zinc finger, RING-like,Zinc finger, RING/FYVE/PHD-type [Cinara cedri]
MTRMAYNDKHKQFLHYFMHERMVAQKDAQNINNILFPNTDLSNTISFINSKIAPLEFKINKVVCEQNGDNMYVFIATFVEDFNAKQDPTKVIFSELVKSIIDADGSIQYDELMLKFNNQLLTDNMIDNFFTNKYLITDENKSIFLSPLAISELEGYLAENYQNKRCTSCMGFVGHGLKCHSCEQFAHGHCLTAYFKRLGNNKCPKCSKNIHVDWEPITIFNELQ